MRYFFHVRDRRGLIRDDEGSELPDLAAAQIEAWLSARDFAMEDLKRGGPVLIREIEIEDEKGRVLGTMPVLNILH
jgi:hypothetical protein